MKNIIFIFILIIAFSDSLAESSKQLNLAKKETISKQVSPSGVNDSLAGHWQGNCKTELFTMQFSINIAKKDTGYTASFNSDEQRALNIPLQNFQLNNDSIHFELRGDKDEWIFDGRLYKKNISGQIKKGTQTAAFSLDKKTLEKANYETVEVTFQNDSVILSGTLYLPDVKEKVPAVLFMHGSGGEKRFASVYFADFLARRGIAVLIYDKRGAGKSTGNWLNSSFTDLANDAIAGIKLLESNKNINPDKIGIFGHSQGGSICPMVLNMYPQIAFGISAASAGVSMEESDWYEVQNRFKRYPLENNYDNAMKVMKKYLQFASTGEGYADLDAEAEKFKKEKWYQNYIGDIDTINIPFFKYYRKIGRYNPVDYWKNVKQPCLILKGDNDLTSPGYPSFQNTEDALKQAGNNKYKIVIFPNTTHEMHIAGSQNEFFFRATPGYCDTIYNWISQIIIPLDDHTYSTIQDSIATFFDEIKTETKKHHQVWMKDLYEPILLVDPETRKLFANVPDTSGILRQDGKIYSGILPNEINIANTALNWNGRRWAMIMLPLPVNKHNRINLLAHELFHVSQPSLGFQLFNTENNHLDQKDGRIYLRLELEALKEALQTADEFERKTHLTDALTFRKYRHSIYPGADTTETLLELNEGLAEYIGTVISGRNRNQSLEHFVHSMEVFMNNPTFVRSFAYQTIPVYGFLLADTKKNWNREITVKTNLTDYFIKSFDISLPNNLKQTADLIFDRYNGEKIRSEEIAREEKTKKLIDEYKSKFITGPHFEIVFEQMNVSFDPRNIMPIEDKGTVYPNIRVTDNWGILTVENGALMSPGWDKISVTVPLKNENKNLSGDGWTLVLNDGYSVIKNESNGNYKLVKE